MSKSNVCVVVTGASQGVGLGIALKFLSEGANVVLVGRDASKAQRALPADYLEKNPRQAFFLSKDLTRAEACKECAEEAAALLGGRIDVLVNNAGSGSLGKNLETTTDADWDAALGINLKSCMFMTQSAIPFLEASRGAVVNISGVAAQRPFTSMLPYCCAKAGVEMLSKCAALELAPKGIRVNCVAPGTIATGFLASAGLSPDAAEAFLEESAACHPIGRIGQPSDVAEAVYFLALPASAGFITGQCVTLDGGRTLTLPSGRALKSS